MLVKFLAQRLPSRNKECDRLAHVGHTELIRDDINIPYVQEPNLTFEAPSGNRAGWQQSLALLTAEPSIGRAIWVVHSRWAHWIQMYAFPHLPLNK